VPGEGRRVRQGSDLVDDHPPPLSVICRVAPGGLEDRVEAGRGAPFEGERELGDDLALVGLLCHGGFAAHHVDRGDRLEQGTLKQLAAGHHEVGRVTVQRCAAGGGPGAVLGCLAEAADEFARQVLGGGQRGGTAVEAELPAL